MLSLTAVKENAALTEDLDHEYRYGTVEHLHQPFRIPIWVGKSLMAIAVWVGNNLKTAVLQRER